jgi:hypothetical protein
VDGSGLAEGEGFRRSKGFWDGTCLGEGSRDGMWFKTRIGGIRIARVPQFPWNYRKTVNNCHVFLKISEKCLEF